MTSTAFCCWAAPAVAMFSSSNWMKAALMPFFPASSSSAAFLSRACSTPFRLSAGVTVSASLVLTPSSACIAT
ncbi:hypothetical protein F751_6570 [Auxenochlorella protothecoides]|uniref:Secreted protein n=1 Tax=Auxenochlorella protothecoides TaxID=3075 RepID=A0A087STJ7_AUXPR|nr:hypothetical protein F751_6570 [Auxenochlorella protothecoides]KFM29051.1 hypothetical protein F751_6570 [Auxenochlorella protothecoides]